jgi:prepilin-type N-terminal cleavage/methylation domain-containing protein
MSNRFKERGFTLIELVVVLGMLGIMLVITVPRFRQALVTNELKSATRKIIGLVDGLRDKAIRENKDYLLHIDFEENRFWVAEADVTEEERILAKDKGFVLPPDVKVIDVWLMSRGKQAAGEIAIRFNRKGYVEKSVIHLGEGEGDRMSLVLAPFLGDVKTYDTYVDMEDSG